MNIDMNILGSGDETIVTTSKILHAEESVVSQDLETLLILTDLQLGNEGILETVSRFTAALDKKINTQKSLYNRILKRIHKMDDASSYEWKSNDMDIMIPKAGFDKLTKGMVDALDDITDIMSILAGDPKRAAAMAGKIDLAKYREEKEKLLELKEVKAAKVKASDVFDEAVDMVDAFNKMNDAFSFIVKYSKKIEKLKNLADDIEVKDALGSTMGRLNVLINAYGELYRLHAKNIYKLLKTMVILKN